MQHLPTELIYYILDWRSKLMAVDRREHAESVIDYHLFKKQNFLFVIEAYALMNCGYKEPIENYIVDYESVNYYMNNIREFMPVHYDEFEHPYYVVLHVKYFDLCCGLTCE